VGSADETEGRALARVALAGNPSDGFGGAVLATVVPGMEAVVRATSADGISEGYEAVAAGPGSALLLAASSQLSEHCRVAGVGSRDRVSLSATTTIPVSVGLAGSSALVVAALRAMATRWAVELDDLTLARLALEAETRVLGIAAGPQDRVVQAAGRTVLMDFATADWAAEPVDPPAAVELLVVWSTAAAEPSTVVHGPLQARGGEPRVVAAMADLAGHARAGASALAAGDVAALGAAMDASFEARASILDLTPAHVALVDVARAAGCHANYAGSGGAIVAVGPASALADLERRATADGHGCHHLTLPAAATGGPPPTTTAGTVP
jgi:glucuronokinase